MVRPSSAGRQAEPAQTTSLRRGRPFGRVAALMIRLRYGLLLAAVVVVTVLPASVDAAQSFMYAVIGVGAVYTTLLLLAARFAPAETQPVQAVASVVLDTLLISTVVWATGGVTSAFFGAYIGIGILAAVYGGLRGAIAGTVFYTVCFAIASLLAIGVIPFWVSFYMHFLLRVAFAAGVSIFAGLLVREADTLASSNAELQHLNRLLQLRSTISEIINATSDPADLLLLVAKRLREAIDVERVTIMVTRSTARSLPLPTNDATFQMIDVDAADAYPPPLGQALAERRPVAAYGLASGSGRALALPLVSDDRVLGAIHLVDDRSMAPFAADDLKELTAAASQVAIKLDNTRLLIDLNRSYVELRQVDQLKSTILANTSHELRTPLTLILGYAEALIGGLGGQLSAEQVTFASGIRQSGKRLQSLVENLLAVASMEKGPVVVELQTLDASRQIDHVVTALQTAIVAKSLTIVRPTTEGQRWLRADQQALRQVLTHLLRNAIQFSQPGGTITIEAGDDDDPAMVQLRVIDQGIGMSPEQVASIFTMFHQVDGSARRAHEGAGLGLYISQRLVEAQGGRINVQSALGHGSTFTVTLPRAVGEQAPRARQAVAAGE